MMKIEFQMETGICLLEGKNYKEFAKWKLSNEHRFNDKGILLVKNKNTQYANLRHSRLGYLLGISQSFTYNQPTQYSNQRSHR